MDKHIIDYRDFQQQASVDISRAEKLYSEGDYGFAAYSAQQALEKYNKAYMMKFKLIENPKRLEHLQYDAILEIMLEDLNTRFEIDKEFTILIQLIQALINYTSALKATFDSIKNSEPLQHSLWKESLGIPTSKLEQDLSQGVVSKLQTAHKQMYQEAMNVLSNTFFSNFVQRLSNIPEERAIAAKELMQVLQNAIQSPDSLTLSKLLETISSCFSKVSYGTGQNSISKKDTDFITDFLKITKTFDWINPIILSYPHEQISRYPTAIGEEDSITLYIRNKEKLWEFIQNIKLTCEQIKQL